MTFQKCKIIVYFKHKIKTIFNVMFLLGSTLSNNLSLWNLSAFLLSHWDPLPPYFNFLKVDLKIKIRKQIRDHGGVATLITLYLPRTHFDWIGGEKRRVMHWKIKGVGCEERVCLAAARGGLISGNCSIGLSRDVSLCTVWYRSVFGHLLTFHFWFPKQL